MNVVRTRLGLGHDGTRFPQKGTCLDIYSRCVNAAAPLDEVLPRPSPGACRPRRPEAAVRRLRRPQGVAAGARLRRPAAVLARPAGRPGRRAPRVREPFDCVLVDEYQDTNALQADILEPAAAGRQRADRGRRRRPVDLRLPRRHGAQHPRLPQAVPRHHGRHAGAELPQHAADPGGHQPGDRLARERYTKNLWSDADRRRAPGPGHLRGRGRADRVRRPADPRAPRGGHRPAAAGRARSAPRTTAWCSRRSCRGATSPSTSTAG